MTLLKATRSGNQVTVVAEGQKPTSGYITWLDATIPESGKREYTLFWEPPIPTEPPGPTPFKARARFQDSSGLTDIEVRDSAGPHVVPIV